MLILRTNGEEIQGFTQVEISLKYDSVASSFVLKKPYNVANEELNFNFFPLGYQKADLEYEGQRLITGLFLSPANVVTGESVDSTLSGYSTTGTIEDCTLEVADNFQFNGKNLKQISEQLLSGFKIPTEFTPSAAIQADKIYSELEMPPVQTIKTFLTSLCQQRGITMRHTTRGVLLFDIPASNNNSKVEVIQGDSREVISAFMPIDGQKFHNPITAVGQTSIEDSENTKSFTVNNDTIMRGIYRPLIIKQTSGLASSTELVAKMARSAEYKNLMLTIIVRSWSLSGKLIFAGDIIRVHYPDARIRRAHNFIVVENKLKISGEEQTMTLSLVPIEAFSLDPLSNFF